MTTSPFASPASTTGIDWDAANGSLLLIEPLSIEEKVNTSLGEKDAVRANIAVLDGKLAATEFADVLIFPRVLQGQVRSRIGQKVLGRLGQGTARPGQSPPWILAEATEADQQLGLRWLQRSTLTSPAPAQEAPASQEPAWAQQQPAGTDVPF